MQIINEEKFKFQEMIELFNPVEAKSKISYKLVKNLATSPAVKKGIYQALLVINEIVRYMGCDPDKIIIEMARGDEKKREL